MQLDLVDIAAKNMGLQYKETVFWRACIDAGFRGQKAEDEAHKWYSLYSRKVNGVEYLPLWIRNFLKSHANVPTTFSQTKIGA